MRWMIVLRGVSLQENAARSTAPRPATSTASVARGAVQNRAIIMATDRITENPGRFQVGGISARPSAKKKPRLRPGLVRGHPLRYRFPNTGERALTAVQSK